MTKRTLRAGALCLLASLSLASAQEAAPSSAATPTPGAESSLEKREFRGSVMGTSLQITVLGADPKVLEEALVEAVKELRRVEDVFTTWRPSELTRLNAAAGQGPQVVSREQAKLIARALKIGELSGGAFDVTFYSVGKLWDFKATPPKLPSKAEITAALAKVGWSKVKVDLAKSSVELPPGTKIGLGGIAKGYGVDRAMQVIMKRGIRHALVNAGGDLKALGRDRGQSWEVAVRNPRQREQILAVLPVSNVCVVTSGDYERFFEHEGKRYHHILDPRTGYPSQGCISATVTAPDAAFADALATALCVLGPKQGLELVESLPRVEAILVDLEGKVHVSKGLPRHAWKGKER